jgi:hypothetical protein
MKKIFAIAVLTAATLFAPTQAGLSANVNGAPRAAMLSGTGISISYESKVKLTSRNCGEFEIKYTLKNKSTIAIVRLLDAQGKKIGGYGFSPRDPKGTAYIPYCKSTWEDRDKGVVYSGFLGGMVTVKLISDPTGEAYTSTGRFQVTK